jgi:cytochrome c553
MQTQMAAWRKQERDVGPLGLMGSIAQKLTDQDVQDVADYYQQLHQGAKPASN